MVEAYFDESGIHDGADICIVAGYFGRAAAWRRLEKGWRSTLGSHNFPLEDFHAKDLVKAHRYQGILGELATAIAKCDLFPISAGIVVADFKNLAESEHRWFTGASAKAKTSGAPSKPYFYPFQMCVVRVTNYTPAGTRAHFSFGCDGPYAEYAVSLFQKLKESAYSKHWQEKKRLGDISFPQAKETPQLQAADPLAHLTYLHWIGRQQRE